MTATKLRELLEAADRGHRSYVPTFRCRCPACGARRTLERLDAPALARLVLELSEALRDVDTFIKPKHYRPIEVIAKALAAVEELEL